MYLWMLLKKRIDLVYWAVVSQIPLYVFFFPISAVIILVNKIVVDAILAVIFFDYFLFYPQSFFIHYIGHPFFYMEV